MSIAIWFQSWALYREEKTGKKKNTLNDVETGKQKLTITIISFIFVVYITTLINNYESFESLSSIEWSYTFAKQRIPTMHFHFHCVQMVKLTFHEENFKWIIRQLCAINVSHSCMHFISWLSTTKICSVHCTQMHKVREYCLFASWNSNSNSCYLFMCFFVFFFFLLTSLLVWK